MIHLQVKMAKILLLFIGTPLRCSSTIAPALSYYRPSVDISTHRFAALRYTASLLLGNRSLRCPTTVHPWTYALPCYRPSMDIGKSGFRYTASLSLVLFFFMTSLNAEVFVNYNEKNDKVVIGVLSEQLASSKLASSKHVPSDRPVEKKTANNGLKYYALYAEQWEIFRSGESILSLPVLNQIINAWLGDRQKKIEIQYPGGEEGEFWVQELTDWLVSLGIPSDHMVTAPGSGADDVINFTLIK